MTDEQAPPPRRHPGGSLPRELRTPRIHRPSGNGHGEDRPVGLRRSAWQDLDDEEQMPEDDPASRVAFRRVAGLLPETRGRAGGPPSVAVLAGLAVIVLVVVVAVVLYRLAPP